MASSPTQAGTGLAPADVLVAVALVGAATWLRWSALGPSSLWLDDAWVALVHRTSGWDELRLVGFSAPGFAAMLKGWMGVAGSSSTAAQLPALLAGAVTPAVAYLLVRWRGGYRGGALLAGVVLAASPIAITYATRVKPYTTEGLLTLAVLALALWLVDDHRDRLRWLLLVVVGAAGTVVSAFLAPTVAAALLAGFAAAVRDRDVRSSVRAVGWGSVYGVLALTWYLRILAPVVTSEISNFWTDGFLTVGDGIGALLASLAAAWSDVLRGLWPLPVPVAAAVVLLALAALVAGAARLPRAERHVEVLVLLVGPAVVATLLAGLQLAPLGGGRTDLYLYPSLMVLVAVGVDVGTRLLGRIDRRAALGATGLVLVLTLAVAVQARPVGPYPPSDVRPLVAILEAEAAAEDAILVYPATVWPLALYTSGDIRLGPDEASSWGFAPRFADPRVRVLPPGRDDPGAYLPSVQDLAASPTTVVWLLASHWREDLEVLRAQLADAGFTGTEVDRAPGARLERYTR